MRKRIYMQLDKNSKEKKEGMYKKSKEIIKLMLAKENDELVKMTTISAVLKQNIPYFLWVGFYRLQGHQLLVGPYQGNPACLRIPMNKGVCGKSASEKKTIIVDEVEKFPDYITCDSNTKSEIVVPVFNRHNELIGILDVDSQYIGAFDQTDQIHLEELMRDMFSFQ
jgi:L-methionine (R)-S-oxide reductase